MSVTKSVVALISGFFGIVAATDTPSGSGGAQSASDAGKIPLLDSAGGLAPGYVYKSFSLTIQNAAGSVSEFKIASDTTATCEVFGYASMTPLLTFQCSAGALGVASVTSNNTVLGQVGAWGVNTSSLIGGPAAKILAVQDGAAGSDYVPGAWKFYTQKAASGSITLAATLDHNQNWTVVGNVTGANLSGTNTGDQTLSDATISTSDITTNNVSSTKHGFAPKSPADATKFLNGAATPDYAQVKDSDVAFTDITTNNVSTSKHGFAPKGTNTGTQYLDDTGAYSTPFNMAQLLYSNTSVPAGNTVASTASETAFNSSYTIPANSLIAGDVIDIWLSGVYSTTSTPTGRLKVKIGSTVIADTTALTQASSVTNLGWTAHIKIVVQSTGASGALECQGFVEFSTAATTGLVVNVANTAAITIDTTVSEAITATFQWGTSSSSNTITLREMTVGRASTTPIQASGGYREGSSFPGSPYTGQKYYRTDLNLLCYYDGTRWLTVNEYEVCPALSNSLLPLSATTAGTFRMPVRQDYNLYLVAFKLESLVVTTNDASNFWSITLSRVDSSLTSTTLVTVSTSADSPTVFVNHDTAINAVLNSSARELVVGATKTASAGTLFPLCTIVYRLIVT